MVLIADSGATKTDWMIISGSERTEINTQGINPFHQTREKIEYVIKDELAPQLIQHGMHPIGRIYFYGAGCLPEKAAVVKEILEETFPCATAEVHTDLMGAARALCKDAPGIACILGTGSNSCEYNGKDIVKNVSPLGYILGDEGSGAYLGKRFTADCLKGLLPRRLKDGLLGELGMTLQDIIGRVYREPQANRFLASITPYIYRHKKEEEVKMLLHDCFEEFFTRNLTSYDKSLEVSFTGSIAWFFQDEIKEVAKKLGYKTGKFVQKPINGLADYHTHNFINP